MKGTKSSNLINTLFDGSTAPKGPRSHHCRRLEITFRHTTLSRTPLVERSARQGNLYLTKHNTRDRQTSMPSEGFESAVPASGLPQTHALDSAATGICQLHY